MSHLLSDSFRSGMLEGPAGCLEAVIARPEGKPRAQSVVAHPHPLYGGSMDNLVVLQATDSLVSRGVSTLRFNFRGVGKSGAVWDEGRGERQDLQAMIRTLGSSEPLFLAGYSFGAVMTLLQLEGRATEIKTRLGLIPEGVLVMAPPITHYDFAFLEHCNVPIAIVCGDRDDLTPRGELERQANSWPGTCSVQFIEDAGHDLGTLNLGPGPLNQALERGLDALGV